MEAAGRVSLLQAFKSNPGPDRKLLPGCTMLKWKQLSLEQATKASAALSEHTSRRGHSGSWQPTARRRLLTWFSHARVVGAFEFHLPPSSPEWVWLPSVGTKRLQFQLNFFSRLRALPEKSQRREPVTAPPSAPEAACPCLIRQRDTALGCFGLFSFQRSCSGSGAIYPPQ